jgi:hypothetical protein
MQAQTITRDSKLAKEETSVRQGKNKVRTCKKLITGSQNQQQSQQE